MPKQAACLEITQTVGGPLITRSREAGKMPHKKHREGEKSGKLKGVGHTAKLAAHQTRSRQACKWYKFNLIKLLKSHRANCANALCPGELKIAEVWRGKRRKRKVRGRKTGNTRENSQQLFHTKWAKFLSSLSSSSATVDWQSRSIPLYASLTLSLSLYRDRDLCIVVVTSYLGARQALDQCSFDNILSSLWRFYSLAFLPR